MGLADNKAADIALELTRIAVEKGKFFKPMQQGQGAQDITTALEVAKVYQAFYQLCSEDKLVDPATL